MSYNFSWIKCQKCLHIHFIPQFCNNQLSISPYIPGTMHSYFICVLSMWLAIDWQSFTWSLIPICWISTVKVDWTLHGGSKRKNIPKKDQKNIYFLLHFRIQHGSIDKCSKNPNGVFCFKEFTVCQKWSFFGIASCMQWWYLTNLSALSISIKAVKPLLSFV